MISKKIYKIGKKIFFINRSITGKGVKKTLLIFKKEIKKLKIKNLRSGTKVFDWKIPPEWNVEEAYIKDKFGKKIIDIKNNNLHLVGYSTPTRSILKKKNLLKRIHSIKKQPNAIPYLTSYYKKYWGFCETHKKKREIEKNYNDNDKFFIKINSKFNKKGSLTYGELIIPGKSKKEILISTYICHPQMANNEISGPLVSLALANYFSRKRNQKTLRFLFLPETIGSIAYINKNLYSLKQNVIAGYVLSCVGDEKSYSLLKTKYPYSISNLAAQEAFKTLKVNYNTYSFLERGSDERQFNSPKIDLPIASIMRTKYGKFPEYHTSLDDFNLVTINGLNGAYKVVKKTIDILMKKIIPVSKIICEPQLSKKKLYETLNEKKISKQKILSRRILDFLQYSDGKNDIFQISKYIKCTFNETKKIYKILLKEKLLEN